MTPSPPSRRADPEIASGLTLRTVGHGTLPADDFVRLVQAVGLSHVVDVRSYPGSRRHPQFGGEAMAGWLAEVGVAYSWEPRLGGRRSPQPGSRHVALRSAPFRAYADHQSTPEYAAAVDGLLRRGGHEAGAGGTVAVMCAESVWWRCHRMLLADTLVLLHGARVEHLFHDGRLSVHVPTAAARVEGDALVYDLGVTPPLS